MLLTLVTSGFSRTAAGRNADCASAFQAYSTHTILLDLLIDPVSKAVLEKDSPAFLKTAPAIFLKPTPPSFAAIVTPRILAKWGLIGSDDLDRLDVDLAAVNVSPVASLARCGRYDETAPALPAKLSHPAILVFEKINGFRDGPSVDAAHIALKNIGTRWGWTFVFTENGAVFNRTDLRRFDAVVWNNVSGDALTLAQRSAFKSYIEHGGGFAAFHGSGGDPIYLWDWYVDTLLGARFLGHPMAPQFQTARIVVDDPRDAIVRDLEGGWTMRDEWYSFESSPRLKGAHILATLDESSYVPVEGGTNLRMVDHPIAWTQCIGNGRSFYSAIGHLPESYSETHTLKLLERGIRWAAASGETVCHEGKEIRRQ